MVALLALYVESCREPTKSAYRHHIYNEAFDPSRSSEAVHGHATLDCQPDNWPLGTWTDRHRAPCHGRHLYGSVAAQHFIWHHQHPESCDAKRFLLYESDAPASHGIGSTLHIATWALAEAIQMDRILLFSPSPNGVWTQGSFCEGFDNFHDCYFEPISSCNYHDVVRAVATTDIVEVDQSSDQRHVKLVTLSKSAALGEDADRKFVVPTSLLKFVQDSNIRNDSLYFWWRAQGLACIVRPTARTLAGIKTAQEQQSWTSMPDGAISVHVRHGNKGTEMPLLPDETYLALAEDLVRESPGLNRVIYLSSEDPQSVAFFTALDTWTVLTVNATRPEGAVDASEYARSVGADQEVLKTLVDLDFALQCFGWVGTIESNWGRMIEELRSTIRCKAQGPYIDAHYGRIFWQHGW